VREAPHCGAIRLIVRNGIHDLTVIRENGAFERRAARRLLGLAGEGFSTVGLAPQAIVRQKRPPGT
jgi:hypothetical protein